jgi:dienelactone hydrolase
MFQLSSDTEFHFEILRVMSLAPYEGADIGEVLVAANQIRPGDFESFYTAFNSLAIRVDKVAKAIDSSKHLISARNALFKAASYYRSADFFLHGNWTDPRIYSLWDKQLAAFNAAIALLPVPGERVNLRAKDGNFTIPAIFFGTGLPGPRPTILMCNGYDGSQEEMYHLIGQVVVQRGMNVITFEGPGQPTVRREQNLGFIPQWERVVTPIVDYALTRLEVDPAAIGLMGYSFGGFLAPRAAAFEHRVAAVFAVDGVYNFGQSLQNDFPAQLIEVFKSGNATLFNSIINEAVADPSTPSALRWSVQQGMWSFNVKTPFEWMTKAQEYNLVGLTQDINVPVFVGDAQDDQFFPGQATILAKELGDRATYHYFKAIDGAGEHCSIGASVLEAQVLLDWLQDILCRG